MLDWNSSIAIASKIDPGIVYHLKKFSAGRRAEIELALADYRSQISRLSLQHNEGIEQVPLLPGTTEPDTGSRPARRNQARLASVIAELQSLTDRHEKVANLRTYLKRVDGFQIDGKEATIEAFIADGPQELADEAFDLIKAHGSMTDEERKNSLPLSTSPVAEGGAMNSTIVGRAETEVNTQSGIAESTSPAT